ncbi:hypothetical protein HJC99_05955 [Candidatus Saccharibacteria bacterium]|nr:hypothetical protein [Candidatus Saccharibacteria bacterium]
MNLTSAINGLGLSVPELVEGYKADVISTKALPGSGARITFAQAVCG